MTSDDASSETAKRVPIHERWAASPLSFSPVEDRHPPTDEEWAELNRARRAMGLKDVPKPSDPN